MRVHKRAHNKRSNPHHDHKPSDEMDVLISTINELDIGWKADVCKLQKHHKMYGDHCDQLEDVELLQLSSDGDAADADADSSKSGKKEATFGEGSDFQAAWAQAKKPSEMFPQAESIPDDRVPDSFDWRDVNGFDFTGKVRDQKACGSCYTVAFTQVAEARLKLKTGKEVEQISP